MHFSISELDYATIHLLYCILVIRLYNNFSHCIFLSEATPVQPGRLPQRSVSMPSLLRQSSLGQPPTLTVHPTTGLLPIRPKQTMPIIPKPLKAPRILVEKSGGLRVKLMMALYCAPAHNMEPIKDNMAARPPTVFPKRWIITSDMVSCCPTCGLRINPRMKRQADAPKGSRRTAGRTWGEKKNDTVICNSQAHKTNAG